MPVTVQAQHALWASLLSPINFVKIPLQLFE